jgi:hypothetical protein
MNVATWKLVPPLGSYTSKSGVSFLYNPQICRPEQGPGQHKIQTIHTIKKLAAKYRQQSIILSEFMREQI